MCLGQVCRITAMPGDGAALVDDGARDLRVSLLTLDEPVREGDWLLVHAGFALARLTAQQARDALAIREPTGEERP